MPMQAHEVAELISELRNPNTSGSRAESIRERIILDHQGLVRHFIKAQDPSEIDDLVQLGNIGIVRAIDNFDLEAGTAFATFAAIQIRGEISHYLRDQRSTIRVPRNIYERTHQVTTAIDQLSATLERMPSVREISEHTGLDQGLILEVLESLNTRQLESLSEPASWDSASFADEGFDVVELRATLSPALELLADSDRQLIDMRFYQGLTQSQIAQKTGLSQVTVSRRISQILIELRRDTGEL